MKIRAIEWTLKLSLFLGLGFASTARATSYTLTVSADGSGIVSKNPTNSSYPSGVTVTITATPSNGWYFANWSGDTNGSVNPLNVVMSTNLVITGNFLAFPNYTLTLSTNGQGAIGLNPPGGSYLSNSVVTATANPANGWVFTSWSGNTNTSANPVSLTLNTDLALTGNFAQLPAFDLQPASVTNAMGSTISFFSHAMGALPLGYQWFFSGGSLTNATNATLALINVSSGQAGTYWAIATNNYGSATSHIASLTLTNSNGPTNVVNSPDEASLRAAIALGGWVGFGFSGTITLSNTIDITNNVALDGSGVSAIISGGNAVRLFYVAPGVTFSATNLVLANGSVITTNGSPGTTADGGAIYNDNGALAITGCIITNNSAQSLIYGGLARGGAIFNHGGTVTLWQTAVSNNVAIGGGPNSFTILFTIGIGLGGAIYSTNGTLTITGCNVNSNLCSGICEPDGSGLTMGGAVFQASGSTTITNSILAFNQASGGNGVDVYGQPASSAYGGALTANSGSTIIDHSQFFENTATGGNAGFDGSGASAYGGAVYSSAKLTINDTSFGGNKALAGTSVDYHAAGSIDGFGGAIYNSGTAVLNRCSIYSNMAQGGSVAPYSFESSKGFNGWGGGIYNASQFAATNCTIALNTAAGGMGIGGYSNPGTSGNAFGGGVCNNNTNVAFIIMNGTIATNYCNSPFGFEFTNGTTAGNQIANTNGALALHNSLIAGTNSNAYGPITDDGFNICSDGSASLNNGASYNFTDPQLGPLANYGGPTLCMALLPSSPAIDSGDDSDFPATDQRDFVRPIGDGPDMGAYEFDSHLPSPIYLNIAAIGGNVQLSYWAVSSDLYRLQASINLSTWTDLSTNGPFSGPTNISQTISQQGFPVRYYRLLVQ